MHRHAIAERRLGRYPASFVLALAANALFFFSLQGTFPVLPGFITDVVLGQPPEQVGGQVGMATTILSLAAALSHIPAGQLADRFGRRRFMFLGAACYTLAPLIYVVSPGMASVALGRAVHGVGLALFAIAFQALVADLAPPEHRGEALGLGGASLAISSVSAPLVSDWLVTHLGYTPYFLVSAGAAGMSMLLVTRIAAPPKRRSDLSTGPRRTPAAGLRLALAQKGIRAGVLAMAALGIPFGAFISFLPLVAEERGIAGSGVVFSAYAGTVMLAQPLAGRLSDRVGRRAVILPGLAIVGLATAALSLDGSLLAFTLAGAAFGLGRGLARGGVDALVQDSVPPTLRGTAVAIQFTSFDFWIGFGTYPLGLLAQATGYATVFLAAGFAGLFGGAALALALREARNEGHEKRKQHSDS